MTTDVELIAEIRRASSNAKLVTIERKLEIEIQIEAYQSACILSRGSDKQRAAHWSGVAFTRGRGLQALYKRLTLQDWIPQAATKRKAKTA
jgi:hypothetical protein